jgi:hypothetical protein
MVTICLLHQYLFGETEENDRSHIYLHYLVYDSKWATGIPNGNDHYYYYITPQRWFKYLSSVLHISCGLIEEIGNGFLSLYGDNYAYHLL